MQANRPQDSNLKSFQEVYETSYSHGLESIYRIENIDLKTVRKLSQKEPSAPLSKKVVTQIEESNEGEFDLGPVYSGYISAFVVKEPIQSLKLSRHTEKALVDQGLKTLEDLRTTDLSQLVFVKGIGQGHIVEVKEKLNEYFKDKPLFKSHLIDFTSWIRCLVGNLECKMAHALLSQFNLAEEVSLTNLESVELKKLTLERKQELIEQAKQKISTPDKVKEARERLAEIESVFLKPWITSREGVATEQEIAERLESVSLNPSLTKSSLDFIRKYFTNGNLFFLPQHNGLIFADAEQCGKFCTLEQSVENYLWSPSAKVPYVSLVNWIRQDYLKKWNRLSEPLLYKVVALSNKFARIKLSSGELLVRHSFKFIR